VSSAKRFAIMADAQFRLGTWHPKNERNDAAAGCFPLGLRVGGIEKKDKMMAGRIMFFPTMIYPS
jgi:hypothetical protein